MKLVHLELNDFRNFNNFRIDFTDNESSIDSNNIKFILGDNGSGKTSIFEAVLTIIASFYSPILDKEKPFEYKLKYIINNLEIELKKFKKDDKYCFALIENNKCYQYDKFESFRNKVLSNEDVYIPQKLIFSYSGFNNRLKHIYNKVKKNYLKKENEGRKNTKPLIDGIRFIHSDDENVLLYLIPIWHDCSYAKKILMRYCNVKEVTKIEIKINMTVENLKKILSHEDFNIYRNLRENTNSKLINAYKSFILIQKAIQRLEEEINFKLPVKNKNESKKIIKLDTDPYLNNYDKELIKEFENYDVDGYHEYGESNHYIIDKLNSSLKVKFIIETSPNEYHGSKLYELLLLLKNKYSADINILIKTDTSGDKEISSTELSEGECNLIKFLGMLTLINNYSGIVMLDEPDVHLNPNLKYKFRDILNKLLSNTNETQVIINTHDPLVINGVENTDVRILHIENKNIYAKMPATDAKGKSIDGLLRSQYFNMETTFDYETMDKFKQRENLYKRYIQLNFEKNSQNREKIETQLRKLNYELVGKMYIDYRNEDKEYELFRNLVEQVGLKINLNDINKTELDKRKKQLKTLIYEVIKK